MPYPWFTSAKTPRHLPPASCTLSRCLISGTPHGERVRALLQQSLAQFQSSQRIRDLEDQIIALGEEIDRIPQGCLIGLEGGEELLEDYRRVNRSLAAAQSKERRLEGERSTVDRDLETNTPWTEPGRQALRRAFRSAPPGTIAHAREGGWGNLARQRARGVA